MQSDILSFVQELEQRPEVIGVILFGSWARGNHRPDSDVDLVVIISAGFRRTVEHKNDRAFEIIYTTEDAAVEYWQSHKDDCVGTWEVAQVLFDKDGAIKRLQTKADQIRRGGKEPINELELAHFRYNAEDQLSHVRAIAGEDPTTSGLLLANNVFGLTELYFDVRQLWAPAPKQRLAKVREISPGFYSLLEQFYQEHVTTRDRLELVRKMIPLVFEK